MGEAKESRIEVTQDRAQHRCINKDGVKSSPEKDITDNQNVLVVSAFCTIHAWWLRQPIIIQRWAVFILRLL